MTGRAHGSDTLIIAMREAVAQGREDLALALLGGTARAYMRSSRSGPGWQINDSLRPFPDGTKTAVYVDSYQGNPKFYVAPADWAAKLIERKHWVNWKAHGNSRPVNPDSKHGCLTVADSHRILLSGHINLSPHPTVL